MEVQYFTFDKTYACDECKERKCEEEFKHGGYFDLEDKDFVCRVCWKDDSDAEDPSGVPDWVLEQRAEEVEARYSWDEDDTDMTSLPAQECPDSPPPNKCVCEKTPDNDYPCLCDEASDSDDDDSDAETEVFAGLEKDDALGLSYVEPPAPLLTPSDDTIIPPPAEFSDEEQTLEEEHSNTEDLCSHCEYANDTHTDDSVMLDNGRLRCGQCYAEHGKTPTAVIMGESYEEEFDCGCPASKNKSWIMIDPTDNGWWYICEDCMDEYEEKGFKFAVSDPEEDERQKKKAKWLKVYGSVDEEIVERRRELIALIRDFEDKMMDMREKQERDVWRGAKPLKGELRWILDKILAEEKMRGDGFVLRWKDAIEERYKELFGVADIKSLYTIKKKGVYGTKTDEIFKYMGEWEDKMDAHTDPRQFIEICDWRHTIKKEMLVFDKYIKDKRRKTDPEAIEKWDTFTARVRCRVKDDIHRHYCDV